MGSTYILGHGAFVPESKLVAKATFSTMPYGSEGGWQTGWQNPQVPTFPAGEYQRLRGLGGFVGLGIAPAIPVIVGTGAAAAAIGGLIALVQNALADDWSDSEVFKSHARAIHSAMLAMQCLFGGSQANAPLVDTFGNQLCKGGTKPICKLSNAQLIEWRALRDGFSAFWTAVSTQWLSPSNAQALRLKGYAKEFTAFYNKVASTCAKQGVALPVIPSPDEEPKAETPGWLKWTVAGVGFVSVAIVVRYAVLAFRG